MEPSSKIIKHFGKGSVVKLTELMATIYLEMV